MTMKTLRIAALTCAAILLPVITSCGSDDDGDTPPAPVTAFDTPTSFGGTTLVSLVGGSDAPEQTSATTYTVTFDLSRRTITLLCKGANFGHGMPVSLNITMRDIPLVVDGERFSFAAGDLIPYLGEDPYPNAPISDLSGSGKIGDNATLSLTFKCALRMGAVAGQTFLVTADGLRPVS